MSPRHGGCPRTRPPATGTACAPHPALQALRREHHPLERPRHLLRPAPQPPTPHRPVRNPNTPTLWRRRAASGWSLIGCAICRTASHRVASRRVTVSSSAAEPPECGVIWHAGGHACGRSQPAADTDVRPGKFHSAGLLCRLGSMDKVKYQNSRWVIMFKRDKSSCECRREANGAEALVTP